MTATELLHQFLDLPPEEKARWGLIPLGTAYSYNFSYKGERVSISDSIAPDVRKALRWALLDVMEYESWLGHLTVSKAVADEREWREEARPSHHDIIRKMRRRK